MNSRYVRVGKSGDGPSLSQKSRFVSVPGGTRGLAESLDGYFASKQGIFGEIDDAHATFTESLDYLVV
jgi:hypothetical protein